MKKLLIFCILTIPCLGLHTATQLHAQAAYCAATGYVDGDERISAVHFAGIESATPRGGYVDSTHQVSTMYKGITYTLRIDANRAFSQSLCAAYIDWNHDFVFSDATELVTLTPQRGGAYFTASIQPPADAVTAVVTRMRVVLFFQQPPRALSPCGTTVPDNDGSVQDYGIQTFDSATAAPACASVLSPTSGATGLNTLFTISFGRVAAAQGYRLYLDTVAAPTRLLAALPEDSLSYPLRTPLQGGKQYYLTVEPYNTSGQANGCAETIFTVSAQPPACPQVLSPLPGDSVDRSFVVRWQDSAALQLSYQVRVGPTNPPTQVVGDSITGGSFIVPNQPGNAHLFVQVLAQSNNGLSAGCPAISVITRSNLVYCPIRYVGGGGLRIDSLRIGTAQVGPASTPAPAQDYRDYSAVAQDSISVGIGDTLEVRTNAGLSPNRVAAYADWNQDGVFDEVTEHYDVFGNGQIFTAVIIPPASAAGSEVRLRTVLIYQEAGRTLAPCGVKDYDGSAYDVTLLVRARFTGTRHALHSGLCAYPNPVAAGQALRLATPLAARATWQVYDAAGRSICKPLQVAAGAAYLPTSALSPGLYTGVLDGVAVRFSVH